MKTIFALAAAAAGLVLSGMAQAATLTFSPDTNGTKTQLSWSGSLTTNALTPTIVRTFALPFDFVTSDVDDVNLTTGLSGLIATGNGGSQFAVSSIFLNDSSTDDILVTLNGAPATGDTVELSGSAILNIPFAWFVSGGTFDNTRSVEQVSIVISSDNGGGGTEPVPLPAAAWLMLGGLGALTGRQWNRKRRQH